MDFGKVIKRGIDADGNANEIKLGIVDSMIIYPISRSVEERVKVHNADEELAEYQKFSAIVHGDPEITKPEFRIITTRVGDKEGYYYIEKCYTKLEHFDKA